MDPEGRRARGWSRKKKETETIFGKKNWRKLSTSKSSSYQNTRTRTHWSKSCRFWRRRTHEAKIMIIDWKREKCRSEKALRNHIWKIGINEIKIQEEVHNQQKYVEELSKVTKEGTLENFTRKRGQERQQRFANSRRRNQGKYGGADVRSGAGAQWSWCAMELVQAAGLVEESQKCFEEDACRDAVAPASAALRHAKWEKLECRSGGRRKQQSSPVQYTGCCWPWSPSKCGCDQPLQKWLPDTGTREKRLSSHSHGEDPKTYFLSGWKWESPVPPRIEK